jgi:uncharacterized protein (TIGR02145 family)
MDNFYVISYMKHLLLIFSLLFFFSCEDKKDTTPPEVNIVSPISGSTVNEMIKVTCMSTDNKGVEKVELWIDGVNTGLTDETEPYSFQWNTTTYKDGDHTLIVRSYDSSNNEGDSPPITVKVDNTISVPKSVSVQSADFSNGGFTIKWSKATDGDFKSYTLEHSIESGMEDYGNFFTTEDVNVTNTRMENTSPLTFHYFRVTVTDTFLYQTKGSIYSTSLDPVPDSVDVDTVTYDIEKMTVKWGESKESDFGSYKLLYSKTESGDRDTVEKYTDKNTTSYSTTTYDPIIENWYWVIVSDTLGQSKIGNGKTNTIDTPPSSINIKSVTYDLEKMIVEWDGSSDWDFKEFKLLYSLTQNGNKDTLKSYTDINTTSYITTTFDPTRENWYFLEVVDYFGQSSIGSGMTNEIESPPTQSELYLKVYEDGSFIITWSQNDDEDFQSYTLYESLSEDMSGQTEVFTSENNSDTSYTVTGVSENEIRYYQIVVDDMWGLQSDSEVGNLGFITDIDANVYKIVQIGDQVWMAENLKVTHYRNGDEIPTGLSTETWVEGCGYCGEWALTTDGAYAVYDDNSSNIDIYGNLYNWHTVDDSRGISPTGFHIPTDDEFTLLENYLGGKSEKMKDNVMWNGTNESGFSALPAGRRNGHTGLYQEMGYETFFLTSESSKLRELNNNTSNISIYTNSNITQFGASIRCVRD